MSSYDYNQSAGAPCPPPSKVYVMPPPPVGYQTMDSDHQGFSQNSAPVETKSRFNGFWKGCSSILRCFQVLESCCQVLECCSDVMESCS